MYFIFSTETLVDILLNKTQTQANMIIKRLWNLLQLFSKRECKFCKKL